MQSSPPLLEECLPLFPKPSIHLLQTHMVPPSHLLKSASDLLILSSPSTQNWKGDRRQVSILVKQMRWQKEIIIETETISAPPKDVTSM